jgi:hypothetical protein
LRLRRTGSRTKNKVAQHQPVLNEFIDAVRNASVQLVANLNRASELVQSFKQVAADRGHLEQRRFEVGELTEQVLVGLRPELRKRGLLFEVVCEPNLSWTACRDLVAPVFFPVTGTPDFRRRSLTVTAEILRKAEHLDQEMPEVRVPALIEIKSPPFEAGLTRRAAVASVTPEIDRPAARQSESGDRGSGSANSARQRSRSRRQAHFPRLPRAWPAGPEATGGSDHMTIGRKRVRRRNRIREKLGFPASSCVSWGAWRNA